MQPKLIIGLLTTMLFTPTTSGGDQDDRSGFRQRHLAYTHATIVVQPGEHISDGTILLRDGIVVRVGTADAIKLPIDTKVVDASGMVVYPGFIDGLTTLGVPDDSVQSKVGAGRQYDLGSYSIAATMPDNRSGITPEFSVADVLSLSSSQLKDHREVGFTNALVAPTGGVVSGLSSLVSLSGRPRRESLTVSAVGLHIPLHSRSRSSRDERQYPGTLMGRVAHLRQAYVDAERYVKLWEHFKLNGGSQPPYDVALKTLSESRKNHQRTFWEANTRDEILRVLRLADEFRVEPVIVGGREAWKVADKLADRNVPVILRVDFPKEPKLKESKEGSRVLPYSSRALKEDVRLWEEHVRCSSVLSKKGVAFCFTSSGLEKMGEFNKNIRVAIQKGLPVDAAIRALTTDAASILHAKHHGRLAAGSSGNLVVMSKSLELEDSKIRYVVVDGSQFEFNDPKDQSKKTDEEGKAKEKHEEASKNKEGNPKSSDNEQSGDSGPKDSGADPATKPEPFRTEIEVDRVPAIQSHGDLAIRNATILTITKGVVENGTVLISQGKIRSIGQDISIPEGCPIIDGTGMYVMPGIIDTHSHICITGGGNEWTRTVVPEVRIEDVLNGDDSNIYRALAGGVTVARILHGSSNPIGGQDAVIKLRWRQSADNMMIRERPMGVKFALGENPKRSEGRYPDTRLGVEAVIRRAFEAGKAYDDDWQRYAAARAKGENVIEPRRDLRLEALRDILDDRIKIHCHSYRADEILMLLRLTGWYGIRVQSLQHVLEGYKVAAEIAAHGASCSSFADWWAYKVEVFDAIPHNTSLLNRAGAQVVIKSDDRELMRHLYQEAAKSLRYGGMSDDDALAMITSNAAAQIGLEARIGSIEVGKDADLAIFNGHPLNAYSSCEYTVIDGHIYFDRPGEATGRAHGSPSESQLRSVDVDLSQMNGSSYVLRNAHIVPVVGNKVKGGSVLIEAGTIKAIGDKDLVAPKGSVEIDLKGLMVYPGMINASGNVGLAEIGSVPETQDHSESGKYNADIRASIAVHPDSEIIPVTRANGVLTVLSEPSGGIIPGQSVLMNLHGWIPPEMAILDPAALHIRFPRGSYLAAVETDDEDSNKGALESIKELKQVFEDSLTYSKLLNENSGSGLTAETIDPQLAALAPYAKGKKLVMIDANSHGDILAAIEFAQDLKLNWVLSGGSEAWKCTKVIKEADVAVLLGPSMALPRGSHVPFDAPYRNAAALHKAGIQFAITSDNRGPDAATSARNLPFQAAMAISYGLPEDVGLQSVTVMPAKILGVSDKLGSIEVGKMANLVICDGDMLQTGTQVKGLFIRGEPMEPTSRHTRLYEKYLRRLKEVQSGKAMLGVPIKN